MSELTFLSDNDNEILKALKLADEIGKISDSSTMQASNEVKKLSFESESIISDNNSVFTSVTELSADSGYPMNSSNNLFSTYNSLKFVPEFRNVCHDAQSLDLMFDLLNERCKFFEEKI
ncbi:hypothetical protein CEXT_118561 [Caerostris extrusa]|uniref:Uncharacterized protein n=1 Tax=Caerostris extrusa TaxID=172846 RepID=A0AAV4RGS9_CAEEX|nr:hypothetical protein CEXT_118561 [Caerostris extrusa]